MAGAVVVALGGLAAAVVVVWLRPGGGAMLPVVLAVVGMVGAALIANPAAGGFGRPDDDRDLP